MPVGFEQFMEVFGNITISTVVVIVLAIIFCYRGYKQFIKYLDNKKEIAIQKHEAEKTKDEQLKKVLEEVNKYPQYREQSRQIQKEFRDEIDGLKQTQQILADTQGVIQKTLRDMQDTQNKRDRNKLRDRLLQSYRYYTNPERNPSQSWTNMEAEAFWGMFGDYEEAGGDGFIHTVVQPAMNRLKVTDDFE